MTSSALPSPAHPGPVGAWIAALRPKTLAAGATPVLVGCALAGAAGAFDLAVSLACLAGALLLQVASNLVNDLFDHLRGADGPDRMGPARAAQQGWLGPRAMAWAATASLLLAVAVGSYLVAVGGWPILAIGLGGLVAAVAYTAGPVPLGYVGLGDPLVFLFFGPVAVAGTVFVQVGRVAPEVWWASASLGALATAILVVNNLRDRHSDARAAKRTLAVRFGATACRVEYTVFVACAYGALVAAVLIGLAHPGWLLPLGSLPMAGRRIVALWRTDGADLNAELEATARLEALFGALLAVGVLL